MYDTDSDFGLLDPLEYHPFRNQFFVTDMVITEMERS